MREILFRGKRIDNGEWVFGDFIREPFGYCIQVVTHSGNEYSRKKYVITEDTVGQYTGMKGKHGKRIFEGDILLLDDIKGIVNYGTGCFCVKLSVPNYLYRSNHAIDIVLNEYPDVEIIGNIHDNPELLEKQPTSPN